MCMFNARQPVNHLVASRREICAIAGKVYAGVVKPKKNIKRFDIEVWKEAYWKEADNLASVYSMAIANPEVAIQFALFVTEFTHLEVWMDRIASLILGTDENTAAHVMSAVVSANARIELMRRCLERARRNSKKPLSFDEIITRFETLNSFRNKIVHARYTTRRDTDEVLWLTRGSDPLLIDLIAYEPFDVAKLEAGRREIVDLTIAISQAVAVEFAQLQPSELQEH